MKKLSLYFLLLIFSYNSIASVPPSNAVTIYNNIAKANGIKNPPQLYIDLNNNEVNAYTDGKKVVLFKGILDISDNEDEIALVEGHELSHWLLHHKMSNWKNEYAADSLGAKMMTKAGYDICKGKQLFKKFPAGSDKTHPSPANRYKRIGSSC